MPEEGKKRGQGVGRGCVRSVWRCGATTPDETHS